MAAVYCAGRARVLSHGVVALPRQCDRPRLTPCSQNALCLPVSSKSSPSLASVTTPPDRNGCRRLVGQPCPPLSALLRVISFDIGLLRSCNPPSPGSDSESPWVLSPDSLITAKRNLNYLIHSGTRFWPNKPLGSEQLHTPESRSSSSVFEQHSTVPGRWAAGPGYDVETCDKGVKARQLCRTGRNTRCGP